MTREMTREEYNDLTDEQRYSYILKLEEEKKVSDKALEKVLDSLRKNTTEERYVLLDTKDDENSIMLRASDIIKAERTLKNTTIVTTSEMEAGENKTYAVENCPLDIKGKIEGKW